MLNIIRLLVLLWPLANTSAQCNLSIRGKIIDTLNQKPLSDAVIEISGVEKAYKSNQNGEFIIDKLCKDTYLLHITHYDCEHLHVHLVLAGDTQLLILMKHEAKHFHRITITEKKKSSFNEQPVVSDPKIFKKDISQSLASSEGASTLKTGYGVGKPLIYGLHSQRVPIIDQGVRLEGQNWGAEHAPEIDANSSDDIRVIKGPESLIYASDGIGSIVLLSPQNLNSQLRKHSIINEFSTSYNSNGRGIGLHDKLLLKPLHQIPLYLKASITIGQTGNISTPAGIAANTGWNEQHFSGEAAYLSKSHHFSVFHKNFNSKYAIYRGAHSANIQDLQTAILSREPLYLGDQTYELGRPNQTVKHRVSSIQYTSFLPHNQKVDIQITSQKNHRSEYDILRSSSSYTGPVFDYYLNTHQAVLLYSFSGLRHLLLRGGLNYAQQSNAFTGRVFIPGYKQSQYSGSFYIQKTQKKMVYSAAFRYDGLNREAYLWRGNTLNIENRRYSSPTYSLQTIWNLDSNNVLGIRHSSSWRAPGANELYSDGLHQGVAAIEKGDPNISPERDFHQSLEWAHRSSKWHIKSEAFIKYIHHFIYLKPGTELQLSIRGAYPVFKYVSEDVLLRGMIFRSNYTFNTQYRLEFSGSAIFGDVLHSDSPLYQTPPHRLRTDWVKSHQAWLIAAGLEYTFKQYRFEEGYDFTAPPDARFLLNARIEWKPENKGIHILLGAENLLNTYYRDYLNRMRYYLPEAGRNIYVQLKWNLKK